MGEVALKKQRLVSSATRPTPLCRLRLWQHAAPRERISVIGTGVQALTQHTARHVLLSTGAPCQRRCVFTGVSVAILVVHQPWHTTILLHYSYYSITITTNHIAVFRVRQRFRTCPLHDRSQLKCQETAGVPVAAPARTLVRTASRHYSTATPTPDFAATYNLFGYHRPRIRQWSSPWLAFEPTHLPARDSRCTLFAACSWTPRDLNPNMTMTHCSSLAASQLQVE